MKKNPWRHVKWIVLGLVVAGGAYLLINQPLSAREPEVREAYERPVKTMLLYAKETTEARSFPGVVKAACETKLAFRVGGPLVELNLKIGQAVEKGALIARIDPRDYEVKIARLTAAITEARATLSAMRTGARPEDIAQLKADLKAAQARFTEAELNFNRYKILFEEKAAARATFDSVRAAYDMAKAGMEASEQALEKGLHGARPEDIKAMEARIQGLRVDLTAARNALADTRLLAPFSGVINRKFVENFETVAPGQPIFSMLDFTDVEVRIVIPEDILVRREAIADFSCAFDAYPGEQFPARLKEIGRKTDNASQSYPMTVVLQLPGGLEVNPGMAATVTLDLADEQTRPGFPVPVGALFPDADGNPCVWTVDESTMTVKKVRVSHSNLTRDSVNLLSGVEPGDRVVTAGARFLREGQKVRLLEQDGEGRA